MIPPNVHAIFSPRGFGELALVAGVTLLVGCGGGDTPLNNNGNANSVGCPSGYVRVPKGTFILGYDPEELEADGIIYPSHSGPAHAVTLTADFCMSKTEVTVAQYRQCRAAGNCTGESPDLGRNCNFHETDTTRHNHPINCLTYEQAREYCQAQGGDLPTEAQWFRAAQGEDRRYFAWGNSDPDCSHANYDVNEVSGDGDDNGFGCDRTTDPPYTWSVGSAPAGASPYGLLDMTGNVSELVLGCGAPFFEPCDGELGCVDPKPDECDGPYRLALGGNFTNPTGSIYTFLRTAVPMDREIAFGIRCVVIPRNP